MKTLLAIVNEPDESGEFVKYALGLAAGLRADLHLLYVQNPANYPLGVPGLTGEASVQIEVNLQNLADEAKKILARQVEEHSTGDVSVRISAMTGMIKPLIEELIGEGKTDMVLLGSIDQASFWTHDSTNMEIIRNIGCPVWVVPRKSVYHSFSKILYATDYREEDIPTLKKLIAMAGSISSEITALHITDSDDFEIRIRQAGFHEMIKRKTAHDRVSVKSLVEKRGDDTGQLINDYASLIHADLIVVLKENRHFLERLFKSSVTREIIEKARIPVLVYHAANALS
jgi:nucleotide-binding universal stress UspA family protein